jgi:hypothetical protein
MSMISVRRRAAAVLVLVLAVAGLAACGDSGNSDAAPSSTASGTPSPGIDAQTVKVGYVIVDAGPLADRLGFKTVNQGTYENKVKAIQAVVDAVNANGGMGGRQIQPTFQKYDAQQDSPEYAESQCKALTQDTQVFAVVMDGQFQNNLRPCYAAARTEMFDQTLIPQDATSLNELAPFFWAPALPDYAAFAKAQVDVLNGAGYFNGSKGVKVVAPDTEVTRRIVEQTVLPGLQALGVPNSSVSYVDSSNPGTLGAGSSAALAAAQSAGQDRILMIGGARILPNLFADPLVADLDATYSISSWDNPAFFVDNQGFFVAEKLQGMAGLGFMQALDLRKDASAVFPDPARPTEVLCKNTIDAAGAAAPEGFRENYRITLQYCDSTLAMDAALDKLADGATVTPESFRDAMWSIGPAWTSAMAPSTGWPAGQYVGIGTARGMYFDPACVVEGSDGQGCYRYGTADIPLTAPPAATPAPGATTPAAVAPTP